MKAQAQGLLFFLVWGIGFLIGTLWNGWLIGLFRAGINCDWPVVFAIFDPVLVRLVDPFCLFIQTGSIKD